MDDNTWAQRYWAYGPSDDPVDIGPLLGFASSITQLRVMFGDDIDIWDSKNEDWL